MNDLVRTSVESGCATITLARPESRNAMSLALIQDLRAAITSIAAKIAEHPQSVRVVVIAGEGKSFCAGMDLRAVAQDPVRMGEMLKELSRTLLAIRELAVPTIARVQGAAIGGGCGIVVVCDFAVTHESAKLGYPEVDLGVCPAVVAPWLIKKIGAGAARAMLLMGGTMSGIDAHARGLVSHCVAEPELDETVKTIVARLLSGGANALACTKKFLNQLDGSLDHAVGDEAASLSARVIAASEAQERLARIYGTSSKPA